MSAQGKLAENLQALSENKHAELFNVVYAQMYAKFDKECPPAPKGQNILTDKDEILNEFKKWIDFWTCLWDEAQQNFRNGFEQKHSATNVDKLDKLNKRLEIVGIQLQICENAMLGYHSELKKMGLCQDFTAKYASTPHHHPPPITEAFGNSG